MMVRMPASWISDRKKRPKRRRWLAAILMLVIWTPIIAFALSNFWLRTAWGAFWLEKQIQQRVQMKVQLRGSSWLPGGQIWIDDLKIFHAHQLPSDPTPPIITIHCLSIRLDWRALLRKEFQILEVCLNQPESTIAMDRLKSALPQASEALAKPSPLTPLPQGQSPAVASQTPKLQTSSKDHPHHTTQPPAQATTWLKVHGGRLIVTHNAISDPVLDIENIDLALPIAGDNAMGHMQCQNIRSGKTVCADHGRIVLQWKFPVWETDATPLTFAGIHSKAKMQIARAPGLPFAAILQQEKQPWGDREGRQKIGQIQSLHRFAGFLLAPMSWQGESIIEANQLDLNFGAKNWKGFFAQSRFLFHQGLLHCQDLRFLGEDSAILLNGITTFQGEWRAHVRITAPRHKANHWQARWLANHPASPLPLISLYNEDRQALDLVCGGHWEKWGASLDQGKSQVPARDLAELWQQPVFPNAP